MPPQTATIDHAAPSPSGEWTLELRLDASQYRIRVKNANGAVVLEPTQGWASRHRTLAGWDDAAERVWVYSGDVGTQTWTYADGVWTQRAWAGSGLVAPGWLQAAVPRIFKGK